MWRFLAGMGSTLVLVMAGFFIWQSQADNRTPLIPDAPAATADAGRTTQLAFADVADPPRADPKTKEEKRFNRFDKDKNGGVSREEYLTSRRKAYAKLDINGDGTLSFDEYAVKTVAKFGKADGDRSGVLTRSEFATTRVIRKEKPKPNCPPSLRAPAPKGDEDEV
jgi:EF hand